MSFGPTLIKPKEIELADLDGKVHRFVISRFDAIKGREIVTKYLTSNLPRLGDYDISNKTMLDLMSYVGVPASSDLGYIKLTTPALIINHVPDWELLGKIEKEMIAYNSSFFEAGKISSFFEELAQKFLQSIFATLMQSSPPSAEHDSPPSTNSEQSTT